MAACKYKSENDSGGAGGGGWYEGGSGSFCGDFGRCSSGGGRSQSLVSRRGNLEIHRTHPNLFLTVLIT